MFDDLMLDLETMGLPPTGAVISIGACFFDIGTETIGPTFLRTVNLATAVRDGGTLTPSTIVWWLGQSQEARDAVRFSGIDIRTALQELTEFIETHSNVKTVRPWGNGSNFDITIMDNAFDGAELPRPWYFTNIRDFRTVRCLYPQVEYNPDDKGKDAHNALADAIFQTKHLFKIKNRNKAAA